MFQNKPSWFWFVVIAIAVLVFLWWFGYLSYGGLVDVKKLWKDLEQRELQREKEYQEKLAEIRKKVEQLDMDLVVIQGKIAELRKKKQQVPQQVQGLTQDELVREFKELGFKSVIIIDDGKKE